MPNAVWNNIAKGKIDPVYLLTGVERHIFDSTIDRLKKALPEIDDASIVRFDLEETPIEAVIEEADTLPFLQEHKLIIANNAFFLTGQDKKKSHPDHNITALEEWLNNPSPTATVVFIAPYEKLDGRKRITKKMRESATVIEANRLEGKDLIVWIQQEAGANGVSISPQTAEMLVSTVGDQLVGLSSEIEKMAIYLGANEEITETLIEEIVPRTPEANVYRLTDAYLAGDISKTIAIYHDLLRNGEEPIMLTALIASQIRLMVHVKSLRDKGYQQNQIAKTLRVHWYRVKLIMENRHIPPTDRLLHILNQLANIDYKLKTTSGKRERLLELFFMNRLQQRQAK